MAYAFESKASTGVLIPLLILADIFAITYYRKDVNWKALIRLFPAMAVGVIIGVIVGEHMSSELFKKVMAGIIVVSGIGLVLMDRINLDRIPENRAFAIVIGLMAGFSTMIGNLAGPLANIYFLAMKFPKKAFIGTIAWLFFFINIFKLPFHIWVWKTVNTSSLKEDLWLIPFVIIGFGIGILLIEKISESLFKKYIIGITLLGAVLILL